MTTHPFDATVITMTFNQREKVFALLDDLERQDYPSERIQVVVLDDGGTDGTYEALVARVPSVGFDLRPIRRERQKPYLSAKRWNDCIRNAARAPTIIQVDDVRVRPDFIRRHVEWHTNGPRRVVTGARFEAKEMTWDLRACPRAHLAGPHGEARETDLWTACWGASLSYPRTLVEDLSTSEYEQPFDERMHGWGFHEVEFAYRAFLAGARLVYDPNVGVFHQRHGEVADAGRGLNHKTSEDEGARRNREYLLRKHGLAELPRW